MEKADDLTTGRAVAYLYSKERQQALEFYDGVLGLRVVSSDDFGDFLEAPAGGLVRLTAMPGFQPSPHPVFGIEVSDVEAAVDELGRRGVSFEIYDGMGQDAKGIWAAPGGANRVAFLKDRDGNVVTLSSR